VNWFYFTNPSQEVFLTLARLNVQPAFLELDKRKRKLNDVIFFLTIRYHFSFERAIINFYD